MLYSPPPASLSKTVRTAVGRAIRTVAAFLAERRRRRIQRVALRDLMELGPARLYDLGIDRLDVIEALRHTDSEAARMLEQRRASNAARR
jgi:hypothetical protein